MKKRISWLLALSLLLSLGITAAAEEETGLPAVGETIEGFTVQELRDIPFLGGTAVLFEHDRTGAKLLYIANSDTERCFALSFATRALDNTGTPHVFEHATTDGSEKYPSTSLFFNLSYQTYNTYMNAMTGQYETLYPVASLSEAQLLKLADYYTDSCLHPLILEDESIFRAEAWRYRLADADAPLSIEGTVYSEMLAAMNINSAAWYNTQRAAYPGSTVGNVSGGDPAFIPDLTWDELKSYHERYYHPSNCLGYLYGEFEDYTAFLRLLDEAFAPYERQEFRFDDEGYTPLTEPVVQSLPYAVEAGSNTAKGAEIRYAFVMPGLNQEPETQRRLVGLTKLLGSDASPLMQKLKKALPGGAFYVYLFWQAPDTALVFDAGSLDVEDAALFQRTVDEALKELAESGFASEFTDSVANAVELDLKLSREGSNIGVNILQTIFNIAMNTDEAFVYFDVVESLDHIVEWNEDGSFRQFIRDWLVDSRTTALVTTYPEAGLREQLDAAEAERLAEVKAAMSEEEIAAIVAASNAEPTEPENTSALVASLQAVTVDSLPEEVRDYTVTDETGEDGVRRLFAEAEVDGVGSPLLMLDVSGLPQEDILWFALYNAVLGELDTKAHTSEELASLRARYLYNGTVGLKLINSYASSDYHPYLAASWTARDEDLETGYALVYELLFDTRFDDSQKLLGLIQKTRAALKTSITNDPYERQLVAALGADYPYYAYLATYSGLDYYGFLESVEALMEENPAAVQEKLAAMQESLRSRSGAVAAYAGTAAGAEINGRAADDFFAKLSDTPIEPQTYDFAPPALSSALIVDSGVQYNGLAAGYGALGLDGYNAGLDAVASLVSDLYLYPMLRDQYGVYSIIHYFENVSGVYLYSYRDPNIDETYAVYEGLPAFLEGLEIDQEKLDGYILSAYSALAMPEGELQGAVNAITNHLVGIPADDTQQCMRELKALTPEAVKACADVYARLLADGYRFTSGGAGAINARAELFDEILNPFGAEDLSEAELADVPEEHARYEAVRFVFENLLMAACEDGSFGVDEPATLGELASALCQLGGLPAGSEAEAVEALAQYGILPADSQADEALTAQTAADALAAFSAAIGLELAPEVPGDALSRGDLAEVLYGYYNALA